MAESILESVPQNVQEDPSVTPTAGTTPLSILSAPAAPSRIQDPFVNAPPVPKEAPEQLPVAVLEDMYTFGGIDNKALFANREDPSKGVEAADTTVFMGNFLSKSTERLRRTFTIGNIEMAAKALDFGSEAVEKIASGSESSQIFGQRLRNFSINMKTQAYRMLKERQEAFPLSEDISADKVFADATSSVLTSLGLMAASTAMATAAGLAAPAVLAVGAASTATSFGVMAFLDTFSKSRGAGQDYENSLAFATLNGAASTALDLIGLHKIFGTTYTAGVDIIARRIRDAVLTEAGTEMAQTTVELGIDKVTGAAREMNLPEFLGQVIYSGAVAALAGGTMVSAVALPQRHRAIGALKQAGLDQGQAEAVYKKVTQEAMDDVLNGIAEDQGYDDIQNRADQRAIELATSPDRFNLFSDYLNIREFKRADFISQLQGLEKFSPEREMLAKIRMEAEAEVRGRENQKEVRVTGLSPAENAVAMAKQDELPEPLTGKSSRIFFVAEPQFSPDISDAMRVAIRGRISALNEDLRPLEKAYRAVQKEMLPVLKDMNNPEIKKTKALEQKLNILNKKEAELFSQIMPKYIEAEALRTKPESSSMQGKELKIKTPDLIKAYADFAREIVRTAKENFRLGRSTTRAEFQFIRSALIHMVNRPGLKKDVRNVLRSRFSSINTKEKFLKNLSLIEQTIEDTRNEALIADIKAGIERLVEQMTPRQGAGRAGLSKVNLDPDSQRRADAFVKEYRNPDTNPSELRENAGRSPADTMRWLASQLATGKNGVTGFDLTPLEIGEMFLNLREFVLEGKTKKIFAAEVARLEQKKIVEKFLADVKAGATGLAGSGRVADHVFGAINWATGLYSSHLGLIARHANTMFGRSFVENVFNVHNAARKAEAINMFYRSEIQQAMLRSYPGLRGDLRKIQQKMWADSQLNGGNSVHFVFAKGEDKDTDVLGDDVDPFDDEEGFGANGALDVPEVEMMSIDLSRAEAREKWMLRQSPEGERRLRALGWNNEAFTLLEESLSAGDKKFVLAQLKIYEELYGVVNEVFRKLAGYDLPFRRNYSSLISDVEFRKGTFGVSALFGQSVDGKMNYDSVQSEGYFKTVKNNKTPLVNIADTTKLAQYIHDMSHYVGMAETLDRIQRTFNTAAVREAIETRFGGLVMEDIDHYVKTFVDNSVGLTSMGSSLRPLNKVLNRLTEGLIAAKPYNFVKQSTALFAGMELVHPVKFMKYLSEVPEAVATGKIRVLTDSAYMRARGQLRMMNRDQRILEESRAMDNDIGFSELLTGKKMSPETRAKFDRVFKNPKFLNMLFLPTQAGDLNAIVWGSWPVYRSFIDQGMSEQEALNRTIRHIDETQQSPDFSQVPAWALSSNPLVRSLFAFKQSPVQYMNRVLSVLQTVGTKNWDPKKFAQVYALFFVFLPYIYDAVQDVFRPEEDPMLSIPRRLAVGLMDDMVIVGPLYDWAVTNALAKGLGAATGEEFKEERLRVEDMAGVLASTFKNLQDAKDALDDVLDGDMSPETVLKLLTEFSEASLPAGGVVSATARQGFNAAEGLVRLSNEGELVDTWRRFFMLAGASRYSTRPVNE